MSPNLQGLKERITRGRLLLAAALMLGTVFGSSTAFAHVGWPWEMVSGWKTYGSITHSTTNDPLGFPDFSYDSKYTGWADADYPNATHFKVNSAEFFNGSSASPDRVVFGPTQIWDEYGNNSKQSWEFYCMKVDGIDEFQTLDQMWDYDGLGTVNNYVYWEQKVWWLDSSSCLDVNDALTHWSDWQSAPD